MIITKVLSYFTARKSKQREIQNVTFLTEQDESSEKKLKVEFCQLFGQRELVKKAYLALAQYDGSVNPSPTLCIFCGLGTNEKEMVSNLSEIVRKKFRKSPLLDVLFLTDFQEMELHKVCKPFYSR